MLKNFYEITATDKFSKTPAYELSGAKTDLDGKFYPSNCFSGRLTFTSGTNKFIKYRKDFGWILYEYSNNLTGCDEANVNDCQRISAFSINSFNNPPSDQSWHYLKESFPAKFILSQGLIKI